MVRQVVVQVGESDFVLCPDWLSDDDLVDVVELVPVFIPAGETEQSAVAHIIQHLFFPDVLLKLNRIFNQTSTTNML